MRHSLQRTAIRKRPMKLGTTVILMVSAVLFSVLLVVHLIYFSQISNMTRDALASKALAVARTLANSPEIRQGLMKKPEESGIQAIAQAVNKSNDFLFIVVTDMQSIRYSHPEAQRIGQPFKGDDILLALQGKENVAINRGFLAKALRVFTPIYDEHHQQIGVVAIGLELSRVAEQINNSRGSIIWSILFGVLVGLLGTWVFVKVLKRILFGLEPYEISNLFEQRQAMLHSIKEGVIAVDECGEVTLINQAAQELLDYHKSQDDAQLSTLSHAWSQVVDFSQVLHDGTPLPFDGGAASFIKWRTAEDVPQSTYTYEHLGAHDISVTLEKLADGIRLTYAARETSQLFGYGICLDLPDGAQDISLLYATTGNLSLLAYGTWAWEYKLPSEFGVSAKRSEADGTTVSTLFLSYEMLGIDADFQSVGLCLFEVVNQGGAHRLYPGNPQPDG